MTMIMIMIMKLTEIPCLPPFLNHTLISLGNFSSLLPYSNAKNNRIGAILSTLFIYFIWVIYPLRMDGLNRKKVMSSFRIIIGGHCLCVFFGGQKRVLF